MPLVREAAREPVPLLRERGRPLGPELGEERIVLGKLALPLRSRQPLLANDIVVVANETSFPKTGRRYGIDSVGDGDGPEVLPALTSTRAITFHK